MIRCGWVLTDLVGGGAERIPLILAPALRTSELTVLLLKNRIEHVLPEGAPDVVSFSAGRRSLAQVGPSVLRKATARARELDLVVAGLEWAPTFFAVTSAALAGKPAIATVHTNLDRYCDLEPVSAVWWPALRHALRRCATVVAVSEDVRASVVRLGVDEPRVRIIPNPVPQISPHPPASGTRTARILTVAGLRRMKGVDVALEAAAKLADCDFIWTIVGDGPERESLQRRARHSLDGRVEFVGFQPEPRSFYRAADLFVLPSRVEGFSLALLEAMSAGLPVIATRCAAVVEEHLAGGAGELVPVDDAEAMAGAIRSLLAQPGRREAMGEVGRERAQNFRPEAVAARYDELFAEVLAGSGARRRRRP